MKLSQLEDINHSQLPVLCAIAKVKKISAALELGSGLLSTPLFLNRDYFPNLTRLVSLENDLVWANKVIDKVGQDDRWTYKAQAGEIVDLAKTVNISDFDLCLIDDSTTIEGRSATIKYVTRTNIGSAILVLHDFDIEIYRASVWEKLNTFTLWKVSPGVGVAWLGNTLTPDEYEDICREAI